MNTLKTLLTLFSLIVAGVCIGQSTSRTKLSPDDATLSRRITGTWAIGFRSGKQGPLYRKTYLADGSFNIGIGRTNSLITYQGTWLVQGQNIVMTVTNARGTGNHRPEVPVGQVSTNEVISLDSHQLTCRYNYKGIWQTNSLTRLGFLPD